MRDAFSDAIAFTLKAEGGWVHDLHDQGGETFMGILRRAHPDWGGWVLVDAMPNKNAHSLQLELAVRVFYRANYWDKIGGDQLPPRLALTVFDWAVNSGVHQAVMSLQQLVGAQPDGRFGPKTLASVTEYMDRQIALGVLKRREHFVADLLARVPALERFRHGWENRLHDLRGQLSA